MKTSWNLFRFLFVNQILGQILAYFEIVSFQIFISIIGTSQYIMPRTRKENTPCLIWHWLYSSCLQAHVCSFDRLPKSRPSLSEFICLSILALTFSQLFPRAARFSNVDGRDDWRHYRAAPTSLQPKQSTHKNAHTPTWMTGARGTHTLDGAHRCPNNKPDLISIIMIHAFSWKFKVRLI